jgi:hypothetical protein
MPLPHDPARLAAITGYLPWRRSVERLLAQLDMRLARAGAARVGEAVVWTGPLPPPPQLLRANGSTAVAADYPQLFERLGTMYNTGGEAAGTFRLPDLGAAAAGVWVVRA